jgi:hypothetical protein
MPKKTEESPFQALEDEAYHAYREWPVWLVLRGCELDAHLTAHRPAKTPPTGAASAHTRGDPPLAAKGT